MTTSNHAMICEVCGKREARIRYVTRSFGQGQDILIIERLPLVTCSACGESYFTADTMHQIERIKKERNSLAVKRPIPVAEYAT